MSDIYSQGIQGSYDGPYVVIIKNGLPMSDDEVEETLDEMQAKIKQLEDALKYINLCAERVLQNTNKMAKPDMWVIKEESQKALK